MIHPVCLFRGLAALWLASLAAAAQPQERALKPVTPGVWMVGGASWGIKDFPTVSVKGDANVYVIELRDGPVMLDCGTVAGMPVIERNIRAAGLAPQAVRDIVFPHSHSDHTEAAELWRTRYNLKTHLSAIGAKYLDRKDPRLFGAAEAEPRPEFPYFHVTHRVADGEVFNLAGVKVTATSVPGHTLDSTIFTLVLQGRSVALGGDFVFGPADWNPEGGGIGILRASFGSSLSDYRDSLKKVLGMKIDVWLPGHGRILEGAEEVRRNLRTALAAVERLLATPRIYVFGVHKPQWESWMQQNH